MIAALFTFGTIWFWSLLAVTLITIVALIEKESEGWADVVFVASIILLYKLGNEHQINNVISWIGNHWFYSILIFVGYFIIGIVYCSLKWIVFLSDKKRYYLEYPGSYNAREFKASENKSRMLHWMMYWPISGLWTLISNPVAKIFNRIFYKLEGFFQKISDNTMREIVEKKEEKEKREREEREQMQNRRNNNSR